MKVQSLVLGMLLMHPLMGNSAVEKKQIESSTTKNILAQPLEERILFLKKNQLNLELMKEFAFGEKYHLKDRWTAMHSLVALKDENSKQAILKAVQSDDWFMRDAAIKLSQKYFPKFSVRLSKKLIKDPSLIVRTSAVKAINASNDPSAKDLLWEALYSQQNYRKGRSLWIRKHIARGLVDLYKAEKNIGTKNIHKFASFLQDKDKKVQSLGIEAMQSFTNKALGNKNTPFEIHRKRWLSWWDQQQ